MVSSTFLGPVVLGAYFLRIFHLGEPSIGIIANGDLMALGKEFTITCESSLENL
jgi:hypothetical protein